MKICPQANKCTQACNHKTYHEPQEISIFNYYGKACEEKCWVFEGVRCIEVDDRTCQAVNKRKGCLD